MEPFPNLFMESNSRMDSKSESSSKSLAWEWDSYEELVSKCPNYGIMSSSELVKLTLSWYQNNLVTSL